MKNKKTLKNLKLEKETIGTLNTYGGNVILPKTNPLTKNPELCRTIPPYCLNTHPLLFL